MFKDKGKDVTQEDIYNECYPPANPNVLIAEFMQKGSEGFGLYDYNGKHYKLYELKFHTSWDWLMPVIHKILKDNDGTEFFNFSANISHALFNNNINNAYKSVVEFIKGYEVMDIHSQYSFYLERCVDEDEGEIALSFEEWKRLTL